MAAKHPEAQALAERVRVDLGARNARDLAVKIGMTGVDDERRVRAWLAGDSAPNFYGTMALLRAGGMLVEEPATTGQTRGLDERALAAAIHEIADVLDRLRSLAGEQEPPQQERPGG